MNDIVIFMFGALSFLVILTVLGKLLVAAEHTEKILEIVKEIQYKLEVEE